MVQEVLPSGFDFGPARTKSTDPLVEREYVKERLALAYRVIAHENLCGWITASGSSFAHATGEGASGHITSRDPVDRDCFWVRRGLAQT
jgi:hypothetical protein